MALRSPPGNGGQWPQLLAFVMDDDDRTRRASFLLWNLTAALLVIGSWRLSCSGWCIALSGMPASVPVWSASSFSSYG
jgi:hypothetical protein